MRPQVYVTQEACLSAAKEPKMRLSSLELRSRDLPSSIICYTSAESAVVVQVNGILDRSARITAKLRRGKIGNGPAQR